MSSQYEQTRWTIAILAALLAAVVDLRRRRIPNALTGPLLLGGFVWAVTTSGPAGLSQSLLGALIAGLPFVAVWLIRAGGAGDAKMMIALGAWLGVADGVAALLGVALAGGVVAIGYAVARRRVTETAGNVLVMIGSAVCSLHGETGMLEAHPSPPTFKGPDGIPYGVAIFVGTCGAAVLQMALQL